MSIDRADRVDAATASAWRTATWLLPVAKLGGAGLSFLLFAAMARAMPTEGFAAVALVLTWLALGNALVSLALPAVVVRTLGEALVHGRPAQGRGVLLFACAVPTALSLLLTFAGLACADILRTLLAPGMADAARTGLWLLAPSTLLIVMSGVLQSLKRILAAELLCNALRSALMLAALLCLCMRSGAPLSPVSVLEAYLLATVLALALCAGYVLRVLPASLRAVKARFEARTWLHSAAGFMGIMLLAALSERVDLLAMGWVATTGEVAVYAVAARFLQPLTVACAAVGAAVAPHLVEHGDAIRAGRGAAVAGPIRHSTKVMVAMAGVALLGICIAGPWLIGLIGARYAMALAPLLILLTGQAVATLFGPANQVAAFTGAPRIALACLAFGVLLNVALTVLLAPRFGAIGTAVASASANVLTACATWRMVRGARDIDTSVFGWRRLSNLSRPS